MTALTEVYRNKMVNAVNDNFRMIRGGAYLADKYPFCFVRYREASKKTRLMH